MSALASHGQGAWRLSGRPQSGLDQILWVELVSRLRLAALLALRALGRIAADLVLQMRKVDELIRLAPKLILVHPKAKRAHQGWRYLTEKSAPPDLAEGEEQSDAMPGRLIRKLSALGLA